MTHHADRRAERMPTMEKITAEEAAIRLGVTQRTLWRWRDAGKIAEAGRVGRSVLFYARDVDALRNVDVPAEITLADVYIRLADAETWEEVSAIKRDVAATLTAQAGEEGHRIIERAWRAACAMSAAVPSQVGRDNWAIQAREYGAWIGKTAEDTEKLIARRSGISFERAREEAREANTIEAALAVAKLAAGR